MLLQIFAHINSYHLSLVKNAQAGKDNANTKTLSVKMLESACFGMMKKPLLYWNLSGNVLTGTRTVFLIRAWKIKLNLLQSTLVGLYLSETTLFFFLRESYTSKATGYSSVWFSADIPGARAIISSSKEHPQILGDQEKKRSLDIHSMIFLNRVRFQQHNFKNKLVTSSQYFHDNVSVHYLTSSS